jgi:hypothetical protein
VTLLIEVGVAWTSASQSTPVSLAVPLRARSNRVVGDVTHRALDEAVSPTVYLSASQAPSHSSIVVVRSALPDTDVIAAVREGVGRLDGNLPVYGVRSMQDVVAASPGMPARRVLTATCMGFALLALVLGAIGLFGVVAHDVASRRAELGLRIALGASPVRILSSNSRAGRRDDRIGSGGRRPVVDLDCAGARGGRIRDGSFNS